MYVALCFIADTRDAVFQDKLKFEIINKIVPDIAKHTNFKFLLQLEDA